MPRSFRFPATVLLLLLLSAPVLVAQLKRFPGEWSMGLNIGRDIGLSASMRGTMDSLKTDLSRDYNNRDYPFGTAGTSGTGIGGNILYRFPESSVSVGGAFESVEFVADDQRGSRVNMNIGTLTLLGEYTIGSSTQIWNSFARLGLNRSSIGATVRYRDTIFYPGGFYSVDVLADIPSEVRYGVEGELGGRVNWPAPVSIEVSASYVNANVLGKSYTSPAVPPPLNLRQRALNDAANPKDPNDRPRTIDYLSIRGGIRVWF